MEGDGVEHDGRVFVAQRVARSRVRKFAHRAQIARAEFGDGFELLAAHGIDGADALRRVRIGVEDGHAGLQYAAADADIVHFTHKGVDGGLEDLRGEGAFRVAADADDGVLRKVVGGLLGALFRFGQVLDDLVHQVDDALVLHGAARHHGDDVHIKDTLADAVDHVLAREIPLLEVLFQQDVVALGGGFRERELHLLVVAAVFFGDGDLLGSRVREVVRLSRQGVGVARHLLAVHDGDLDGREPVLVLFAEGGDGRGIVRVLLVHTVDEDDERLFGAHTQVDRLLRAHRHGAVRARHDDRRAARAHRLGKFALEVVKPGDVQKIDLDVLPGDGSHRKGDGHLARDLLFVEVGDGRPVLHLAHALDRAAVEEHRFKQRGLALAAVSDDGDVADIFCRNTHNFCPFFKVCRFLGAAPQNSLLFLLYRKRRKNQDTFEK